MSLWREEQVHPEYARFQCLFLHSHSLLPNPILIKARWQGSQHSDKQKDSECWYLSPPIPSLHCPHPRGRGQHSIWKRCQRRCFFWAEFLIGAIARDFCNSALVSVVSACQLPISALTRVGLPPHLPDTALSIIPGSWATLFIMPSLLFPCPLSLAVSALSVLWFGITSRTS